MFHLLLFQPHLSLTIQLRFVHINPSYVCLQQTLEAAAMILLDILNRVRDAPL